MNTPLIYLNDVNTGLENRINNTNLIHTLAGANAEKGNLRETFFLNQVSVRYDVKLPPEGDFFY